MTIDVRFTSDEYTYNLSIWTLIRDCIAGEKQIKSRDSGAALSPVSSNLTDSTVNYTPIVYLPMPNPTDTSAENRARYAQYLQRASFYGATSRTLAGMMGMVFKSAPKVVLPSEMEYLKDNVDGSGIGINQQSQELSRDVGSIGRGGLYVDYPQTDGQTSKADAESGGIQATINFYAAECILDWDDMKVGSKTLLSFVKLQETVNTRDTETLRMETKKQYRVLMLEKQDSGETVYVVKVYNDAGEQEGDTVAPKTGDGSFWNHIPFYFVGSTNNRPNVDDAPLQEIADINIKHYRNSADFEESSFTVGQPTLAVSGLTQAWVKEFYPNGLPFGSRAALSLPKDASADLIQVQSNTMPAEGMKHKEEQMISLGARLITNGSGNKTAEAARIDYEADSSALSIGISNINDAYESALDDVALYTYKTESKALSESKDIVFELNTDFLAVTLTPEQAEAYMRIWLGGAIDKDVLDSAYKRGGIISDSKDLEEMNENIDTAPVSAVDFDQE